MPCYLEKRAETETGEESKAKQHGKPAGPVLPVVRGEVQTEGKAGPEQREQ